MTSVVMSPSLASAGIQFTALPPLSLYIHIPWCVKKCPYCDFNSHEARAEVPEAAYVAALTQDLESVLPLIWGRSIHSIFFGGGTPSLLSAKAIDEILGMVRARVRLDCDAEITLEANPGTFETDKFRGFREAGVNRLSIGIQSFNAKHLSALGRIHDDSQARKAVEIAHQFFDNFNLDMMYALPGQSLREAELDIAQAIAFAPPHLSAYHLTLEPNTLFYRQPPPLPDDDLSAEMQIMIEERLAHAEYGHYETSAFALTGKQCRHNLNYWRFGDYVGIGAGAHSKISLPDKVLRQMRYKQPKAYMDSVQNGAPVQEEHRVLRKDMGFEFMMNALRLTDGFPVVLFQERTGLPVKVIEKQLIEAERRGLIVCDHLHIAPTPIGERFLNDLLAIFLPDGEINA